MKQAVALVVAAAALAAPASAFAAPQLADPMPTIRPAQGSTVTAYPSNIAPNRRALSAYANYLTAIIAAEPAAQAADSGYIATITGSNGCKSALEPLTQPSAQVDATAQHTLTVLGQEIGDDLSIAFDQTAIPAFTRFSNTLLRLHWAHLSGATQVIRRYVNAETAVLELLPSQLCQDALLAGAAPDKVPDGTRAFLKSYDRASLLANVALANLTKMMQSYEVPGEKNLITRITSLATQVSALTRSDLLQSGTTLSSALDTT